MNTVVNNDLDLAKQNIIRSHKWDMIESFSCCDRYDQTILCKVVMGVGNWLAEVIERMNKGDDLRTALTFDYWVKDLKVVGYYESYNHDEYDGIVYEVRFEFPMSSTYARSVTAQVKNSAVGLRLYSVNVVG